MPESRSPSPPPPSGRLKQCKRVTRSIIKGESSPPPQGDVGANAEGERKGRPPTVRCVLIPVSSPGEAALLRKSSSDETKAMKVTTTAETPKAAKSVAPTASTPRAAKTAGTMKSNTRTRARRTGGTPGMMTRSLETTKPKLVAARTRPVTKAARAGPTRMATAAGITKSLGKATTTSAIKASPKLTTKKSKTTMTRPTASKSSMLATAPKAKVQATTKTPETTRKLASTVQEATSTSRKRRKTAALAVNTKLTKVATAGTCPTPTVTDSPETPEMRVAPMTEIGVTLTPIDSPKIAKTTGAAIKEAGTIPTSMDSPEMPKMGLTTMTETRTTPDITDSPETPKTRVTAVTEMAITQATTASPELHKETAAARKMPLETPAATTSPETPRKSVAAIREAGATPITIDSVEMAKSRRAAASMGSRGTPKRTATAKKVRFKVPISTDLPETPGRGADTKKGVGITATITDSPKMLKRTTSASRVEFNTPNVTDSPKVLKGTASARRVEFNTPNATDSPKVPGGTAPAMEGANTAPANMDSRQIPKMTMTAGTEMDISPTTKDSPETPKVRVAAMTGMDITPTTMDSLEMPKGTAASKKVTFKLPIATDLSETPKRRRTAMKNPGATRTTMDPPEMPKRAAAPAKKVTFKIPIATDSSGMPEGAAMVTEETGETSVTMQSPDMPKLGVTPVTEMDITPTITDSPEMPEKTAVVKKVTSEMPAARDSPETPRSDAVTTKVTGITTTITDSPEMPRGTTPDRKEELNTPNATDSPEMPGGSAPTPAIQGTDTTSTTTGSPETPKMRVTLRTTGTTPTTMGSPEMPKMKETLINDATDTLTTTKKPEIPRQPTATRPTKMPKKSLITMGTAPKSIREILLPKGVPDNQEPEIDGEALQEFRVSHAQQCSGPEKGEGVKDAGVGMRGSETGTERRRPGGDENGGDPLSPCWDSTVESMDVDSTSWAGCTRACEEERDPSVGGDDLKQQQQEEEEEERGGQGEGESPSPPPQKLTGSHFGRPGERTNLTLSQLLLRDREAKPSGEYHTAAPLPHWNPEQMRVAPMEAEYASSRASVYGDESHNLAAALGVESTSHGTGFAGWYDEAAGVGVETEWSLGTIHRSVRDEESDEDAMDEDDYEEQPPTSSDQDDITDFASEFRDALSESTGVGRVRGQGRAMSANGMASFRGRLSPGYKQSLGEAQAKFLTGDLDEAKDLLSRLTATDPDFPHAWFALGALEEELGNPEKAVKLLFVAGHLQPHNATIWTALARFSDREGNDDQTLYCYNKLAQCRDAPPTVLWERAVFLERMAHTRAACLAYRKLLDFFPGNMVLARYAARLALNNRDLELSEDIFRQVLLTYVDQHPVRGFPFEVSLEAKNGAPLDFRQIDLERDDGVISLLTKEETGEWVEGVVPTEEEMMHWDDVNVLMELILWAPEVKVSDFELVKRAVLTQQGRLKEARARLKANDAEFDALPDPPLSSGNTTPDMDGFGMPLDIRVKLGRLRLKLKFEHLALHHFSILLRSDVQVYEHLYQEAADALLDHQCYTYAVRILTLLVTECTTGENVLRLAGCYAEMGDLEKAVVKYREAYEMDQRLVSAMESLADVLERLGRHAEAAEALKHVVGRTVAEATVTVDFPHRPVPLGQSGEDMLGTGERALGSATPVTPVDPYQYSHRSPSGIASTPVTVCSELPGSGRESTRMLLPPHPQGVQTQYTTQARKEITKLRQKARSFEVQLRFRRIKNTYTAAVSADWDDPSTEAFLSAGDELLQVFLSGHFIANSTMDALYLSEPVREWYHWLLRYVDRILLSKKKEMLFEVYHYMVQGSYFGQMAHVRHVLLKYGLAWAIQLDHGMRLTRLRRDILQWFPYSNDAYRIFLSFRTRTPEDLDQSLTKFMRHHQLIYFGKTLGLGRSKPNTERERFDSMSVYYMALVNGSVAAMTGSRSAAACAVFRCISAYPEDPHLHVFMAAILLERALQRTSTNRQQQILQSISHLRRYRTLRLAQSPSYRQEVEYNYGRFYHALGLFHLAVQSYEACLATEPAWQDKGDSWRATADLRRDAAYNLSVYYCGIGSGQLARKLMKRWCTV